MPTSFNLKTPHRAGMECVDYTLVARPHPDVLASALHAHPTLISHVTTKHSKAAKKQKVHSASAAAAMRAPAEEQAEEEAEEEEAASLNAKETRTRKSTLKAAAASVNPFKCITDHGEDVVAQIGKNVALVHLTGLTVATRVGATDSIPMVWGPTVRLNLTWRLQDDNDVELKAALPDINKSFASWQATCGVRFNRLTSDNKNALMLVRRTTDKENKDPNSAGVIAAAFFPGEPVRDIRLFPDFFNSAKVPAVNRVSVLCHELGHVLGFRHEHIWFSRFETDPRTGRPKNPTPEGETEGTMGAKAITVHDETSIMDYNQLWADMARKVETKLSKLDEEGAQRIYGAPAAMVTFLQ